VFETAVRLPTHVTPMRQLPHPYLLFLGESADIEYAKTAFGLRDWSPDRCLGEYSCPGERVSIGLPRLSPLEAKAQGAKAVVIGVAAPGGAIREQWVAPLLEALEAGLDLISGMHSRLEAIPKLREAAERLDRDLINVRIPPENIPVGTGRKRSGLRLLTVGTDCALGKKYTALAIARRLAEQGVDADFRATGQTGILIAGSGIPIDAVIADFVAGAAELLTPDAAANHWDIVEGQGSIFHPSFAGVSLGLLHGTQPDVIVMCHEVGRNHLLGLPDYATPDMREAIELTLALARRTNPYVRCAGVSLNTSTLDERQARIALSKQSDAINLPSADPMRGGPEFDVLIKACLGT
jgi:uncharacterized NAD-dependent epimerase/dehydratase family protein